MEKIKKILNKTGLSEIYNSSDFTVKEVILRDGRKSKIFINNNDGHGILDDEFWENQEFYKQDYRKKFSSIIDSYTTPITHLEVYPRGYPSPAADFQLVLRGLQASMHLGLAPDSHLRN